MPMNVEQIRTIDSNAAVQRIKSVVRNDGLGLSFDIPKEFIEKSKKKETGKPYAYIDRNYGWTYKINKDFSFAGLCNLVDGCDYMGFKMMSKYSHGTSIHLKIGSSTSIDSIMNMVSSLYIGLYRLITMYCENEVESDFYDVTEKLENIINDYLENSPYN